MVSEMRRAKRNDNDTQRTTAGVIAYNSTVHCTAPSAVDNAYNWPDVSQRTLRHQRVKIHRETSFM